MRVRSEFYPCLRRFSAPTAFNHIGFVPRRGNLRTWMRDRIGYIPTLDGWRAIAIVGVLFAHSQLGLIPWLGHRFSYFLWAFGRHGVELFFAISGLLICTRLLEEETARGRIGLKGFYIRRTFRILPPAFVFLIAVGLLSVAGLITVSKLDWFASLFFFRNYTVTLSPPVLRWWFTSHFWSLAVEEHFYLILPGLLVWLPKWRLRALGILIAAVTAWKWYILHRPHINSAVWSFHTDMCIDSLLIPAFLAIWLKRGNHQNLMRKLLPWWSILVLVPLYAALLWRWQEWPQTLLCAPLLLLATIYNPRMIFSRFLESPPLRWVGRLSYSLYLWQMLFCCTRFGNQRPLGMVQKPPVNMLLLSACAIASFYLVERPLIRLGHRIAKPATAGHKDVAVADTAVAA